MKCVLAAMGILTVAGFCNPAFAEEKMKIGNDGNVVMENSLLKVTVSPIGARIVSLYDKVHHREDVKSLPYVEGLNIIRFGSALNLDDQRSRYELKMDKLADGSQKVVAKAKVLPTEDKPAEVTVTKEIVLPSDSSCLRFALEIRNDGTSRMGLIPWMQNILLGNEKEKPEEAHMTEYGVYISGKPLPSQRDKLPSRFDIHHFPAGNWSTRVALPLDESANTLTLIIRPEDVFKLYNWHRGVDFSTMEVIAQPFFAEPGKSFRWEYFMHWLPAIRNIAYASPDIVVGVSPNPSWIPADAKELSLDFSASREISGIKVKASLVPVGHPEKVIREYDLDLPSLSPRKIDNLKIPVELKDQNNYQLRLKFTQGGKAYFPGALAGDRSDAVIPLIVGKQDKVAAVFPVRRQTESKLLRIEPQQFAEKQAYSCGDFEAFSFPSAQRCFRQDTFKTAGKGALQLNACAGEYESIQLVLVPKKKTEAVYQVSGTALSGPDGSKVICESINDFIYVPTKTPSLYNALFALGEYPEALLPVKQITLKPGGNHPLFITWRIPGDAKPGLYRGSVSLSQGAIRHEIPVELKVWNIKLPLRSKNVEFASSLKGNALKEARHADGTPYSSKEQLDAIVDMHLKYRLTPCDSGMANLLLSGKYVDFEKEMKKFVDAGATKIFLGQIPVLLKNYKARLPEIEKYLKEKGWVDYFYVRPGFDEVASDQVHKVKAVLQDWKKVSSIRTMETYYPDEGAPELFGLLDIWSRNSIGPQFNDRVKAGDSFWKVNAMPGHLEDEPWTKGRKRYVDMWDKRFTGSYIWTVKFWSGVTKWGEDYWSDAGVGNLSAVLMWPHETGILSTIRLEAMRDGLEDNVMLWMLRDKVESLKGKTLADPVQAAALADARKLCSGEPLAPAIKSVEDLERLRNRVGEALSTLNGAIVK